MPANILIVLIPLAVMTVLFLASFLTEPRRLVNGWLFNLWLLSFLATAAFLILNSQNRLLIAVSATLFIIAVLLILAIFALHLLWLAWNALIVWRRESHSLGNMLTLLIALGLLLLEIGASFGRQFLPAPLYAALAVFFTLTIGYVLVSLYNFLTVLVLYNLRWVRHNKDYLIVLGAGLIDGHRVSPLLAARINAGIRFYQRQKKLGKPAKLLFSGGKGSDEQLAESVAMQRFAIAQGVPEADTLIEDRSTTTLENMRFCAAIIRAAGGGKAAFFTNNYHLFRAGLYAKQAGLNANGVGAATSFYFLPNAVIREYLALVVLHKRRHLIAFALILLLSISVLGIQWVTQ
ncbi:ElyC/SanA/YdcF family protein [Lacticaseibacillus baoqingensis]|uniref:ElyC/SanA/YdcF family protein n=1 Tax=Lacticaseibacillus baoqingensis TaxID=2486013 RepID=A0ABW4ECE1_9LACO|nr:YdcF family protein [Lacticaseibacillus baoqingensis]